MGEDADAGGTGHPRDREHGVVGPLDPGDTVPFLDRMIRIDSAHASVPRLEPSTHDFVLVHYDVPLNKDIRLYLTMSRGRTFLPEDRAPMIESIIRLE